MPTALVTGGSGFIGGALIERLRREGWEVRALARSDAAAERVRERGAEPVRGDIGERATLEEAAAGSEVAVHAAAKVGDWGDPAEFERLNVGGTANVIAACRAAGVRRLVHVGTEAALMAGQPLVNVDESAPLRPDSPALYSSSKAKAEQVVRAANGDGLETVVVRPRFVWGRGDTTLLPAITELVRARRFRWIGGGRQLTDTTHVDNTVEGLWLAATKAPAGGVYFVTDGQPVVFREFVTRMLATRGVTMPNSTVAAGVAGAAALVSERIWRARKRFDSPPPITRFAVWVSSQECTIDISRARRELGYAPVTSHEEGLAELADGSHE
ncbi:MAG TPA: NAD-dependent epimerase/dehydratase family protein [Thermoleophilaceae bacterium]|nr:NAD-dependent epimerase/dehydratase family protein [Thermoleophilaceae bacterium]